jgi:hypothetical protein
MMVKLQKMEVSKHFQTLLQYKAAKLASTFVVGRYVLQLVLEYIRLQRDSDSATVQHTRVEGSLAGILHEGFDRPPNPSRSFCQIFFSCQYFSDGLPPIRIQGESDGKHLLLFCTLSTSVQCDRWQVLSPRIRIEDRSPRIEDLHLEAEGPGCLFSLSGLFRQAAAWQ